MRTFGYIDAHCGSGKTDAALAYAIKQVDNGDRVLFIQPTIALIKSSIARLEQLGYREAVVTINSDPHKNVTRAVMNFLDNSFDEGILFLTSAVWPLASRRDLKGWECIVDETPNIAMKTSFRSPNLHHLMTDHLSLACVEGGCYSQLIVNDFSELKQLRKDSFRDDGLSHLSQTLGYLLNKVPTYVRTADYEGLLDGSCSKIDLYHVYEPSMYQNFRHVTFVSANFTESQLYHIWSKQGIEFRARRPMGFKKLSSVHPAAVGEALDIYYLCERWSKGIKSKPDTKTIYETEFKRAAREIFGEDPFIYTVNKGDNQRLFEGVAGAQFVSPAPFGLNSFRHIHNAAVFAHFNLSSDEVSFRREVCKLESDDLFDLINKVNYYQFVCRTSLREVPSASQVIPPKEIIVMDKDMALYLQQKFPGSRVHKFNSELIAAIPDSKSGRKSASGKPASAAERTKNSRDKTNLLLANQFLALLQTSANAGTGLSAGTCNEIPLESNCLVTGEGEGWSCALISKVNSVKIKAVTIANIEELVSELRCKSKRKLASKGMNSLFNVTRFIEEFGEPRGKCLTDVVCSYAILQDMDSETNCCPYAYAALYPGLEMLLYSSFNSTLEHKRWRGVIPLSRPVTQPEYHQIAKDLLWLSKLKGFPFDRAKKQPNDFMYLPCHGPCEEAFFFEHFKQGRKPLDVDRWLLHGK